MVPLAWTCIGFSKNKRPFRDFATSIHGSYNLEKVLSFNSCLSKSFNSVKVLEKYLISLLGLEKFLNFTTLCKKIFVHEQYLTFVSLFAISVPQMQLNFIPSHFPKRCCVK